MYKSIAYWPKGSLPYCAIPDYSEDRHDTKEQAEAICRMLRANGLGGDGKIFPIRTEVLELTPKD